MNEFYLRVEMMYDKIIFFQNIDRFTYLFRLQIFLHDGERNKNNDKRYKSVVYSSLSRDVSRCNQTLYIKYIYIYKNFRYAIQRSYLWVILWTYLAIKFEDFYFTEKFCKEVGSPFETLKFNATSYSFQKLADSWLNLAQTSKESIADCRNTKPGWERW